MTDYMDAYRRKSEQYKKKHLAKLDEYQGHEKQRAADQAAMHAEHQAAMDPIHATTLRRNAEDEAKTRAAEKTRGKYVPSDMKK